MKKDKKKKLHADWYNIDNNWYTLEEYDSSGKYMRLTSVTAWQHIDIDTSNRYSTSWLSDMVATAHPIDDMGLRFDIRYYLSKDMTKEQLLNLNQKLDNKQAQSLASYLIYNYYK